MYHSISRIWVFLSTSFLLFREIISLYITKVRNTTSNVQQKCPIMITVTNPHIMMIVEIVLNLQFSMALECSLLLLLLITLFDTIDFVGSCSSSGLTLPEVSLVCYSDCESEETSDWRLGKVEFLEGTLLMRVEERGSTTSTSV